MNIFRIVFIVLSVLFYVACAALFIAGAFEAGSHGHGLHLGWVGRALAMYGLIELGLLVKKARESESGKNP